MNDVLFRIIPLGGVGAIGQNITYVQQGEDHFLIDAGKLFSHEPHLGIDCLVPHFGILEPKHHYHLFITHAHEDHIGALKYLTSHLKKITLYTSAFTRLLLEKKFGHLLSKTIQDVQLYQHHKPIDFPSCSVMPFQVNHSIPFTFGLLFQTRYQPQQSSSLHGLCFISDFKVDPLATFERPFDLDGLKSITKNNESLTLMVDSTNAHRQGKTLSEEQLRPSFERIFQSLLPQQNLFITLFPSNVHRLLLIALEAYKHQRKVCLVGRACEFYMQLAEAALPPSITLPEKFFSHIYSEDQWIGQKLYQHHGHVYILSGCQGDYRGALKRFAQGEHKKIPYKKDDLFVYSAKAIPGQELSVAHIFDLLAQKELQIITSTSEYPLHASGHASQDDLEMVIKAIEPTHIIPIHGTHHLLHTNQRFFQSLAHPTYRPLIQNIKNFDEIRIEMNHHQSHLNLITQDAPPDSTIYLNEDESIELENLRMRKKIALTGLIHIVYFSPKQFTVECFGLPYLFQMKKTILHNTVYEFVLRRTAPHLPLSNEEQETLRTYLRKSIRSFSSLRPVLIITFV